MVIVSTYIFSCLHLIINLSFVAMKGTVYKQFISTLLGLLCILENRSVLPASWSTWRKPHCCKNQMYTAGESERDLLPNCNKAKGALTYVDEVSGVLVKQQCDKVGETHHLSPPFVPLHLHHQHQLTY